jgi:hypothetical protein
MVFPVPALGKHNTVTARRDQEPSAPCPRNGGEWVIVPEMPFSMKSIK